MKKSDAFFLGKTNKEVKTTWNKRLKDAEGHAKKNPTVGITWSSTVNWHGFTRHLAYVKTLDGRVLHKTEAEGMVTLVLNNKASYMTAEEFNAHSRKIIPFLQPIYFAGVLGSGYWKS